MAAFSLVTMLKHGKATGLEFLRLRIKESKTASCNPWFDVTRTY